MDYLKKRYRLIVGDIGREVHLICDDCPVTPLIRAFSMTTALRTSAHMIDIGTMNSLIEIHEKRYHTERTEFSVYPWDSRGVDDDKVNLRVHSQSNCSGEFCVIHKPSMHHMRFWPIVFDETQAYLAERICGCSNLHPDPDSLAHMQKIGKTLLAHNDCCGCCKETD